MIRPLLPRDAEPVAALIRAAFGALGTAVEPQPSALGVTSEAVRAHLEAGGGGALHGAEGCLLWQERDGALHLSRLAVLPANRGVGIAAALLGHAEGVARAAGLARMTVETRVAFAGNRRLFRRAGFVEVSFRSHPGWSEPTIVAAEKCL